MEDITKTSNEGTQTTTDGVQTDRTFTQEDVNRIVQERLNKERNKIDADKEKEFADREAELARKEFRLEARQELSDRGLPEELLDALNMSDKDTFKKSLEIIDKFVKAHSQDTEKRNELEQKKARFTMPTFKKDGDVDAVRAAMGLK